MDYNQISAISIAIAASTGFVNLLLTGALALTVHHFSKRVTETQIVQRANSQWQDLNKHLMQNPQLQRLIDPKIFGALSDEDIQRFNFYFYVLGVVQEIFLARRRGLIRPVLADPMLEGHLRFLAGNAEIVGQILALERGYDPEFRNFLHTGMLCTV
jgi:hypothetical protein